jgi:hypothetical protein
MSYRFSKSTILLLTATLLSTLILGCNSGTARTSENSGDKTAGKPGDQTALTDERSSGSKIKIEENSPADTVRVFYKDLREKKFREAMYLTNMRPAMEGLTDAELKEFQVDFNDVAEKVPANVEINGEVISGETAVVTANLPGEDLEKMEIQQIKLRRENGVWVILMVDEKAEAMIKKEGKNYFYALRIDTHETEAQKLLQKIADVQGLMASQAEGKFSDLQTLIAKNLLPADMQSAESTGYTFSLNLSADKKSYFATATPAVYGKTGKLSFLVEGDGKKIPKVTSKDTGGLALKK